jgi:16S rRNA (uracil1498-N3)-methyltransferase
VDSLATTETLRGLVEDATRRGGTVLVLHETATRPLALPVRPGEPLEPLWLIVGPEGGIADAELETLVAAGGIATRLGPYVLRASEAGPAAIAAASALRGAWASPPSAL